MKEGYFQFQPGNSVRFTASPEGGDIDWDGPDQVPIPSDISWSEVAIDASSSPNFFASSSIFLSDATNTMATTNTFLSQPGTGVASESVMVDLDELLSGDNPWLQVATIASSSTSFYDSPSTFPLLDVTTNRGTPASANASWIQPSISTTSSQGVAVDSDHLLEQLLSLSGNNPWPESATDASSSSSFFASPSIFPSDAEAITATPSSANTCWIQTCSSIQERLMQALIYIRETHSKDALVQVWVPAKRGDGQSVLTTSEQPFMLDVRSDTLKRFRDVSTQYQFSADVTSKSSPVGLPGRVYMGKVPEWSPDVRYFTREYDYRRPSVHGTMGLPVFEKGNNSCLGVIELVMTTQELSFISERDTICSALQAVNLTTTTTEVSRIPRTKFNTASYKDALPEVLQVLRAACVIHELPLAQTWATCGQQRKRCRRHSDENCRYCISTIDGACYVNDPRVQIFHEACSEHNLLSGQGVAGKAFTTNQRCFLPDIGSSSEQEYPLSHHAKIFKLKGAMAIRLRCTHTGTADFMLEFFLPTDCEVENEQKTVLDSLGETMETLSKTLRMVTDKEMEDEPVWEMNELNSFGLQKSKKPMKRKRMARRSSVWKSFTEVMVGDTVKAKCNYCGKNYCCDSENGTSSLISHLKRCKLNPNNKITGPL